MVTPGRETAAALPVPMGAIEVTRPPHAMEIRGLGSCIALALYDPVARVAGLAHAVIPRPLGRAQGKPAWACTEAAPNLLREMERAGARRGRIVARLAGGASMFAAAGRGTNVGDENARATEATLHALGLPVLSRDVGGSSSRSVCLDASTGRFRVVDRGDATAHWPGRERARALEFVGGERPLAEAVVRRVGIALAGLLGRRVEVHDVDAYELAPQEVEEFLGGIGARIFSAHSRLVSSAGHATLGIVMPEAHALALARVAHQASEAVVSEDDVLEEIANVLTSQAAGVIAQMARARILPEIPPRTARGSAHAAIGHWAAAEGGAVLVLHGRVDAGEIFRGADVAVFLPGAPPR